MKRARRARPQSPAAARDRGALPKLWDWWRTWRSRRWRPQRARQRLGRRSERLALRLLRLQGYVIERTNVRFPVGELDIVAREGDTLCFVEVRSTSSGRWGGPLASVTWPKQQRLLRAARWYLSRLPSWPPAIRFDVVAVAWQGQEGPSRRLWPQRAQPTVELIRAAFEASP